MALYRPCSCDKLPPPPARAASDVCRAHILGERDSVLWLPCGLRTLLENLFVQPYTHDASCGPITSGCHHEYHNTALRKPSSVHSVEPPQQAPLVAPQQFTDEPKEISAQTETPAAPVEAQQNVPEATHEPVAEPSKPVQEAVTEVPAESTVQQVHEDEEQKPAEESYAPVYLPPNTEAPERHQHEEARDELEDSHGNAANGPVFFESPKSQSASLPRTSLDQDEPASSSGFHSKASSDSPNY